MKTELAPGPSATANVRRRFGPLTRPIILLVAAAIGIGGLSAAQSWSSGQSAAADEPGQADILNSTFELDAGPKYAQDPDSFYTGTFRLIDYMGQPVEGALDDGFHKLSCVQDTVVTVVQISVTDVVEQGNGLYTCEIRGVLPGSYTVPVAGYVEFMGFFDRVGWPQDAVFTSPPEVARAVLTVSSGHVPPDGSATHTATVTVTDDGGVGVPDVAVSFVVDGAAQIVGSAAAPPNSLTVETSASGVAEVAITDVRDELVNVTASLPPTIGAITVEGSPAWVAFVSEPVFDQLSVRVSPEPVVANDKDTVTVTVTWLDGWGEAVSGRGDRLVATVPAEAERWCAISSFTETSTPGEYTATIACGRPGSYQVQVYTRDSSSSPSSSWLRITDLTEPDPNDVAEFQPLMPEGDGPTRVAYQVSPGSILADGVDEGVITVTAFHINTGAAHSGMADSFRGFPPEEWAGQTVVSEFVETAEAGVYTATVKSTAAVDQAIDVYVNVHGPWTTRDEAYRIGHVALPDVNYIAHFVACCEPPEATRAVLTASSGAVPPDGSATHTATVTVTDDGGVGVPDVAVSFSVDGMARIVGSTATPPNSLTVVTSALGIAQIEITDLRAEYVQVTASLPPDIGAINVEGSPAGVAFVSEPEWINATLWVTPDWLRLNSSLVPPYNISQEGVIRVKAVHHPSETPWTGAANSFKAFGSPALESRTIISAFTEVEPGTYEATVAAYDGVDQQIEVYFQPWGTTPGYRGDGVRITTLEEPDLNDVIHVRDGHGDGIIVPEMSVEPCAALSPLHPQVLSDGQDCQRVTVVLRQGFGYPNGEGPPITGWFSEDEDRNHFDYSAGPNVVVSNPVEDPPGTYTMEVTSTTAGDKQLNFYFTKVDIPGGPVITLRPPPIASFGPAVFDVDAALTVSSGQMPSDGVAVHTATVTVTDASGDGIADVAVSFSVDGSAQIVGSEATSPNTLTVATSALGIARVDITDLTGEVVNVAAALPPGIGSVPVENSPAQIEFVDCCEPPEVASSTLRVSSAPVYANGTDTATITLAVFDTWGAPISGLADRLLARSTGYMEDYVTVSDFAETATSGVYTATATSTMQGYADILAFYLPAGPSTPTSEWQWLMVLAEPNPNRTVDFYMPHGDWWPSWWIEPCSPITVSHPAVLADGTDCFIVKAEIGDPREPEFLWPRLDDASTYSAVSTPTGAQIAEPVETSPGRWSIEVTATTAADYRLQFYYQSYPWATYPLVASFVPVDLPPMLSTLRVSPASILADGIDQGVITVELKDPETGNGLTGLAGNLAGFPQFSSFVVVSEFVETTTAGVYTASVVSTLGISQQILVFYNPLGPVTGRNTGIRILELATPEPNDVAHFVPTWTPIEVTSATLTVTPGVVANNGIGRHAATVTVIDQFGRGAPDVAVSFAVDGSAQIVGSEATSPSTLTVATSALGIAQVEITDLAGETVNVTAALPPGIGSVPVENSPAQIEFVGSSGPLDPARLTLRVSSRLVEDDGIGTATITVTAYDAAGGPFSGIADRLDATTQGSYDSFLTISRFTETSAPGVYTATVASTLPGSYTIWARYAWADPNMWGGGPLWITELAEPNPNNVASFYHPHGDWWPSWWIEPCTPITVSHPAVLADGTDCYIVRAEIGDPREPEFLWPRLDDASTYSAVSTPAGAQIAEPVETSPGRWSIEVTSTTAADYSLRFNYRSDPWATYPLAASFVPVDLPPMLSTLRVSPASILADGIDQGVITVELKDPETGNGLIGLAGNLAGFSQYSSSVVVSEFVETTTAGVYVATVTSTSGFDYQMAVFYNPLGPVTGRNTGIRIMELATPDPNDVAHFVPTWSPIEVTSATLTTTPGVVANNGIGRHAATATVTDQFGRGVPDVAVSFAVDGAAQIVGSTATPPNNLTVLTSAWGIAQVEITDLTEEVVNVSAALPPAIGAVTVENSPAQIEFGGAVDPVSLGLSLAAPVEASLVHVEAQVIRATVATVETPPVLTGGVDVVFTVP
ncbi:MAG: Ig-like domain-containing protein, partial [Micrococcales bacterium]|nr:Ig-like domain-containing protein [Micrococcales bacterium]